MDKSTRRILTYLTILLSIAIIGILGLMLKNVFFSSGVPTNPADQAYIVAKALVAKNPKNAEYLFDLAKAEADLNRIGDAIQDMKKAIQISPAAPMLHYTLAEIYEDNGQEDEAIKELNEELRVTEQRNELAWYDLGVIMNKRQAYSQAVICLRKALTRMDSGADAHYQLGKAYEGLGSPDLAEKEYEETLRFVPDHAEAQRALQELELKKVRAGQSTTTTTQNK